MMIELSCRVAKTSLKSIDGSADVENLDHVNARLVSFVGNTDQADVLVKER